jgi:hypothetical protein
MYCIYKSALSEQRITLADNGEHSDRGLEVAEQNHWKKIPNISDRISAF